MRRYLVPGFVLAVAIPLGGAAASAPPGTPPPGADAETSAPTTEPADTAIAETTEPADTAAEAVATTPSEPGAQVPATVFNEEGEPIAEIAVLGMEQGFTNYGEDSAPDEGHEYFRMTIEVTNRSPEETFGINIDDFILQDTNGFVATAENVLTAEQVEAEEEVTTEADLETGESIELALTFQVSTAAGPQSVFYRPDEERLVDVAEVA